MLFQTCTKLTFNLKHIWRFKNGLKKVNLKYFWRIKNGFKKVNLKHFWRVRNRLKKLVWKKEVEENKFETSMFLKRQRQVL